MCGLGSVETSCCFAIVSDKNRRIIYMSVCLEEGYEFVYRWID